MKTKIKYLIIPDVHGRTFYIDALADVLDSKNDVNVIFLGDYIDPYFQEGITPDTALDRFKDILVLKRKHQDRITLLLGNHDLHYIDGSRDGVRMDLQRKDEITQLYNDNIDLFDLVKFERIGRKNFVFTHAGFDFPWFGKYADFFIDSSDGLNACCNFNYDFLKSADWTSLLKNKKFQYACGESGYSRGGSSNTPSFLWADLSDILFSKYMIEGCVQIFGHTRQLLGAVRFDNCFCLDCCSVFYINDNGTVLTSEMKPIRPNGEKIKKAYIEFWKRSLWFF